MKAKRSPTRSSKATILSLGVRTAVLFAAVGSIFGCSSSHPATFSVTGTVLYQGKPVDGATVIFGPSAGSGKIASGQTNAEGIFSLSTFRRNDGAVAGNYVVLVTKIQDSAGITDEEAEAFLKAGKKIPQPQIIHVLPRRYDDAFRSGLSAEVTAAGPNDFTFELTDE